MLVNDSDVEVHESVAVRLDDDETRPVEYLAAAAASDGGPPDVDGGPPHIAAGRFAVLVVS